MSIFSICTKPNYQNARSRYRYTFSQYISDLTITAILDVSEIEV